MPSRLPRATRDLLQREGLSEYCEILEEAGLEHISDINRLHVTDEDLASIGVSKLMDRRKLLRLASLATNGGGGNAGGERLPFSHQYQPHQYDGTGLARPLAGGVGGVAAVPIFLSDDNHPVVNGVNMLAMQFPRVQGGDHVCAQVIAAKSATFTPLTEREHYVKASLCRVENTEVLPVPNTSQRTIYARGPRPIFSLATNETLVHSLRIPTTFNDQCISFELKERHLIGENKIVGVVAFSVSFFHRFTADTVVQEWYPLRSKASASSSSNGGKGGGKRKKVDSHHVHTAAASSTSPASGGLGSGSTATADQLNSSSVGVALSSGTTGDRSAAADSNTEGGVKGDRGTEESTVTALIKIRFTVPGGCPKQIEQGLHVAGINMRHRVLRITVFDAEIHQALRIFHTYTDHRGPHQELVEEKEVFDEPPTTYLSLVLDTDVQEHRKKHSQKVESSFSPSFGESFEYSTELRESKYIAVRLKEVKMISNALIGEVKLPIQYYLSLPDASDVERVFSALDNNNQERARLHIRVEVRRKSDSNVISARPVQYQRTLSDPPADDGDSELSPPLHDEKSGSIAPLAPPLSVSEQQQQPAFSATWWPNLDEAARAASGSERNTLQDNRSNDDDGDVGAAAMRSSGHRIASEETEDQEEGVFSQSPPAYASPNPLLVAPTAINPHSSLHTQHQLQHGGGGGKHSGTEGGIAPPPRAAASVSPVNPQNRKEQELSPNVFPSSSSPGSAHLASKSTSRSKETDSLLIKGQQQQQQHGTSLSRQQKRRPSEEQQQKLRMEEDDGDDKEEVLGNNKHSKTAKQHISPSDHRHYQEEIDMLSAERKRHTQNTNSTSLEGNEEGLSSQRNHTKESFDTPPTQTEKQSVFGSGSDPWERAAAMDSDQRHSKRETKSARPHQVLDLERPEEDEEEGRRSASSEKKNNSNLNDRKGKQQRMFGTGRGNNMMKRGEGGNSGSTTALLRAEQVVPPMFAQHHEDPFKEFDPAVSAEAEDKDDDDAYGRAAATEGKIPGPLSYTHTHQLRRKIPNTNHPTDHDDDSGKIFPIKGPQKPDVAPSATATTSGALPSGEQHGYPVKNPIQAIQKNALFLPSSTSTAQSRYPLQSTDTAANNSNTGTTNTSTRTGMSPGIFSQGNNNNNSRGDPSSLVLKGVLVDEGVMNNRNNNGGSPNAIPPPIPLKGNQLLLHHHRGELGANSFGFQEEGYFIPPTVVGPSTSSGAYGGNAAATRDFSGVRSSVGGSFGSAPDPRLLPQPPPPPSSNEAGTTATATNTTSSTESLCFGPRRSSGCGAAAPATQSTNSAGGGGSFGIFGYSSRQSSMQLDGSMTQGGEGNTSTLHERIPTVLMGADSFTADVGDPHTTTTTCGIDMAGEGDYGEAAQRNKSTRKDSARKRKEGNYHHHATMTKNPSSPEEKSNTSTASASGGSSDTTNNDDEDTDENTNTDDNNSESSSLSHTGSIDTTASSSSSSTAKEEKSEDHRHDHGRKRKKKNNKKERHHHHHYKREEMREGENDSDRPPSWSDRSPSYTPTPTSPNPVL